MWKGPAQMSSQGKIKRVNIGSVELTEWKAGRPAPEDILAGPVEMDISVLWRSDDNRTANGLFSSQPSRLRVVHPVDQTLIVLKGSVSYTEEGGNPLVLESGDALVIEAGARYIVEVLEPVEIFWTLTDQTGPLEFLD